MEEVAVNPTIELPELTQDWETDSGTAPAEPCAPGPRFRLAQEGPGVSGGGVGQQWTALHDRDRGSGCSRLGYGISPHGGGHH